MKKASRYAPPTVANGRTRCSRTARLLVGIDVLAGGCALYTPLRYWAHNRDIGDADLGNHDRLALLRVHPLSLRGRRSL